MLNLHEANIEKLTFRTALVSKALSEIVVQKYGGSSVADIDRIKRIASRIVETKNSGKKVVAVVSALGDSTDELMSLANQLTPSPPTREVDMLLASGEQRSIALLSIAIHALGEIAISFTGAQVGIVTDTSHTKAKIVEVRAERIKKELDKNKIVIVAGFQGVTLDEDITTLGRGGSDTTAVAIAAELKASCQIYSDVEGVFTADPRIIPGARKLDEVSFEEMLEMAATGAKVLQLRSVEYGRNHGVPMEVRSSFSKESGTCILEESQMKEKAIISGVTHDNDEAKITLLGVPDRPGIAAKVFGSLAKGNINVDMIIQNVSEQGITDISFTVPKDDLAKGKELVEIAVKKLEAKGSTYDDNIAKVSLVGAGMKSHPGVAAKMFEVFAEEGINIEMISTSSIKISCVIKEEDTVKAVSALHNAFNLERGSA